MNTASYNKIKVYILKSKCAVIAFCWVIHHFHIVVIPRKTEDIMALTAYSLFH